MWALAKDVIGIILIVLLFSQLILPSFIPGMEYWNLFKSKPKESRESKSSLDELSEQADEISRKKKQVQSEVDNTEQKLKEVKSKLN